MVYGRALISTETEDAGEVVRHHLKSETAIKKLQNVLIVNTLSDPAVRLTASRSRSWTLWAFRFAKESYVWLLWIPLLLLGVGIGMNFLAVTMNHGAMPVLLPPSGIIAEKDKMHVAATVNSRFLFLCDWIQLHGTKRVFSPGDFLITAGDSLKWPVVWMWAGFTWGLSIWRKHFGSYANR